MATLSAEAKVKILLSILRTIDASPNMQEVTDELGNDSDLGIDTRKTARRRYKNIVEGDGKYLLTTENKVVFKDSNAGNNAVTSSEQKLAAAIHAAATGEPLTDPVPPASNTPAPITPKKRGRSKKVPTDAEDTPESATKKSRKNKAEADGDE